MRKRGFSLDRDNKLAWFIGIGVVCLLLGLAIGGAFSKGADATDTLPEADRSAWISMAADSFALNGDEELARQRLGRLVNDDLTWKQLGAVIEQEATALQNQSDEQGAQRLLSMADALNLPQEGALEEEPNARRNVEVWRILLFIGAVLVFLALLALGLWYMAKQNLKRQEGGEEPGVPGDTSMQVEAESEPDVEQFDTAPSHALSGEAAAQYTSGQPFVPVEELDAEPQRITPTPKFQAPDPHLTRPATDDRQNENILTDAVESAEAGVLGSYEAEYAFGADDFDCSFTISTPEGVFMGDCGIGVSDVLPAIGPQHVDALEVWLFDKGDVSSVSKFLVSEYAYENPTLNNRLSAKGDLVLAEPGALIILETRSLRITAQVVAAEYDTSIDPNKSYFRRLALEITAEMAD
ncbi:MAG: hypothetical protein LLG44_10845 [Chloroflexi bacterium]|nr:hypothetical protein [Chloroflexota bacterium]